MRLMTCVWPCGCMVPPITPKLMTGSPLFVTKPGMMVLSGRFDGPTRFGWPGVVTKQEPRLLSAMPVPGTTTPEPKP